jgi:hypothetical protein
MLDGEMQFIAINQSIPTPVIEEIPLAIMTWMLTGKY